MKVIKFHIDDFNKEYRVTGSAICCDTGETISVGFYSSSFARAYDEFAFYTDTNGLECQRVIIRKV